MDIIVTLLMLVAFIIDAVGVAVVIHKLAWPAHNERQRQQQRVRQAEQAITDIARWEQEAILVTLRGRTEGRRPGNWQSSSPPVVDGEVLGIEDEPGRPRW